MVQKSWLPNWIDRGRDAEQFRGFKTQIDSLFEDWFGRSIGGVLAPRIDMVEDERTVMLTAELPGVSEKDVEISLAGDQLTIKGVKRSEHEEKKEDQGYSIHRMERSYGAFQRTMTLPYQTTPDQVVADFKGGLQSVFRSPPTLDSKSMEVGSRSTKAPRGQPRPMCSRR
jgi:HSP20 family protein